MIFSPQNQTKCRGLDQMTGIHNDGLKYIGQIKLPRYICILKLFRLNFDLWFVKHWLKMFFKFIVIFLIISITKSWAYLAFDKAISEEKTKDPICLIPITCGVECLLKCLNGNSCIAYGCFDKCSIACTIPHVTDSGGADIKKSDTDIFR